MTNDEINANHKKHLFDPELVDCPVCKGGQIKDADHSKLRCKDGKLPARFLIEETFPLGWEVFRANTKEAWIKNIDGPVFKIVLPQDAPDKTVDEQNMARHLGEYLCSRMNWMNRMSQCP